MRILTFSTLYPNPAQPQHGVFVENRLRQLVASGTVEARVVAPVAWFPGKFGGYPRGVPAMEQRHGLEVAHPRYFLVPKINMLWAPLSLYAAARGQISRLRESGFEFDLIDAHYFYPDGVAAALLAREFCKPFVVTARGTDINLIAQLRLTRRMIQWAAARADAIVTVSRALKDALSALGVQEEKVRVLRNGVDLKVFRPNDRNVVRQRLGLTGTTILSVGGLVRHKGHHVTIGALPRLPGVRFLLAGKGPEQGGLQALAKQLGVADRVTFLGQQDHEALTDLYSAADISVLASSREGWANVLLESMACGTPVVATASGGTPEVIAAPEAGKLMTSGTTEACADAIKALMADPPDRAATRAYAEGFSWDATTQGQIELFRSILNRRHNQ